MIHGLHFTVANGCTVLLDERGREVMMDGSPVNHRRQAATFQMIAATSSGWARYAYDRGSYHDAVVWQQHAEAQYRQARRHLLAVLAEGIYQ